jgi:hypothetical protein
MMLTDIEIEKLFSFCRKHYIHYYEVQAELVDHFADAIEALRKQQPSISFDDALNSVYSSFGGYKGMQKIQEEKKKMVARQHNKLKKEIFLSYFQVPKIFLTVLLGVVCYFITEFPDPVYSRILMGIAIPAAFFWEFRSMLQFHGRRNKYRQYLLLLNESESGILIFGLFFAVNGLLNYFMGALMPSWFSQETLLPIYILFPLYIVFINSYREYRMKVYEKAREMYPKFFAE